MKKKSIFLTPRALKVAGLLRSINFNAFKLLVAFIAAFFPPSQWYQLALGISFFSRFKISKIVVKKYPLQWVRAEDLNTLLALLTRKGRAFPIPYRLRGFDNLEHATGLILCTIHLPLVKVALKALMDKALIPNAALAAMPTKDNKMAVWGIVDKIPLLYVNPYVLLKAKTVLEANGRIFVMIDNSDTGSYSPNMLHLGGKVGAKLVFIFAELAPDGVIETYFETAPHPYCETAPAIRANIEFLKHRVDEIRQRYALNPIF